MNENKNWLLAQAQQDAASMTKNWVPSRNKQIEGVSIIEIRTGCGSGFRLYHASRPH